MNGASAAQRHATAVFGAGQPDIVTDDPEEGGVGVGFNGAFLPVDVDSVFCHERRTVCVVAAMVLNIASKIETKKGADGYLLDNGLVK